LVLALCRVARQATRRRLFRVAFTVTISMVSAEGALPNI
jgi:hypothetical protein